MRIRVVLAVLAFAAGAGAEPRRTTASVALRKKPGEKQTVMIQLAAHTAVVVEAETGRWLRVRVGRVVGYLPRTVVTSAEPLAGDAAGTWSSHVRTDPDRVLAELRPASAPAPAASAQPQADVRGLRPPRSVVRVDAGIGYRSFGFDSTSRGGGSGLANYVVSAEAASAQLAASATTFVGSRLVVGIDGAVQAARSSPGIDYLGPSGPPGTIDFSTVAIDGGAHAGVSWNIFQLAVRGGGRYDAFLAGDVENAGKLPRERLLAGTLGLRADAAPAGSRFALTARFDWLVLGSRKQTPGLEDGMASTPHAVWAGVTIRAALSRHVSLLFAYDFGRATTQWSGRSVREPNASDVRRIDSSQLVQLGVGAEL